MHYSVAVRLSRAVRVGAGAVDLEDPVYHLLPEQDTGCPIPPPVRTWYDHGDDDGPLPALREVLAGAFGGH
jgi:hypothetical protein